MLCGCVIKCTSTRLRWSFFFRNSLSDLEHFSIIMQVRSLALTCLSCTCLSSFTCQNCRSRSRRPSANEGSCSLSYNRYSTLLMFFPYPQQKMPWLGSIEFQIGVDDSACGDTACLLSNHIKFDSRVFGLEALRRSTTTCRVFFVLRSFEAFNNR